MGETMRGLPEIDGRYWLLLAAASICGTNLGDFASQTLGLGFVGGFTPFAILFALLAFASGRFALMGEANYWLAMIVSRAGATNLADFATHELDLPAPALLTALLAALALILGIGALCGQSTLDVAPDGSGRRVARPSANAAYWAAIVVASAFGTIAGDSLADDFGLARAALATAVAALCATFVATRSLRPTKAVYWGVVLLIRAAATNFGDFLAGDEGVGLGYSTSCAIAFSLVAIMTATAQRFRFARAN